MRGIDLQILRGRRAGSAFALHRFMIRRQVEVMNLSLSDHHGGAADEPF